MGIVRHTTRTLYPAIRKARWRRWLITLSLVCMLGLFSIGLTHHHQTLAAELACPVCHVTAHGAPDLLAPSVVAAATFAGWYRHALPQRYAIFAVSHFDLRPPPRAPPVPVSSLV